MSAPGPALALVEVASLAKGYAVLDALVKRAPVTVLWQRELSPGKSLILFGGAEEETLEAHAAAVDRCGTALLDDLLLPHAHAALWQGVHEHFAPRQGDAALIVELTHVASTLLACDVALKSAAVTLLKLRLAQGIGGRGLALFSGDLDAVQAAQAACAEAVRGERWVASELVSQPHEELWGFFCRSGA